MTREEFNAKVFEQYNEYEKQLLLKTPAELIDIAWDIAKMQAIKDYLTESGFVAPLKYLCEDADTILNNLFAYEWDYDTPMWTDWSTMNDMIWDYINEKEESK